MAAIASSGSNLLPVSDTSIGRYVGNGELKVVLSEKLESNMMAFPSSISLKDDPGDWAILFVLDWAAYQAILDGGRCDLVFARYVADKMSLRVVGYNAATTFTTSEDETQQGHDIAKWLVTKIFVTPGYFPPDRLKEM